MTGLQALLASNPYPGRGVQCARTRSGAVRGGYFLTGRSAASRDRALRVDGDQLVVGPVTPAALLSRDGGRTAVLGAARPSSGFRLSTNIMTLTVQDLEPGEGVLMTTYHSDGQAVFTAAPFQETTITARDSTELLEEIWSALKPEFRIAAAVLDPGPGPAAGTVLRSG
jgi:hypothetical protein